MYYYITNHICLGFSKRFSATTLFGKIFEYYTILVNSPVPKQMFEIEAQNIT